MSERKIDTIDFGKFGVIVKEENKEKIMNAVYEVQKYCTARFLGSYSELEDIVKSLDERVKIIPKTHLQNTSVLYFYGQDFPNAYHWIPYSTHIEFVYMYGTWRITRLSRGVCYTALRYPYYLYLSSTAKEALLRQYT